MMRPASKLKRFIFWLEGKFDGKFFDGSSVRDWRRNSNKMWLRSAERKEFEEGILRKFDDMAVKEIVVKYKWPKGESGYYLAPNTTIFIKDPPKD